MSAEGLPTGRAIAPVEPPVPVRSDAVKPGVQDVGAAASGVYGRLGRVPPQAFFGVSAVFHYLGPSLAVLLFARLDVLGVAWLRVASAAARNAAALILTTAGVAAITAIRVTGQPLGFVFAFANCALFMLYIVLGHRIANEGGPGAIDGLGTAMLIAAVVATPWGLGGALPASGHRVLLLAGAGVGVCSSVIPYVTDQLAMARLSRATFSLMLALLPVFATAIGAVVLRQLPTVQDVAGITLVVLGVALHKEQREE